MRLAIAKASLIALFGCTALVSQPVAAAEGDLWAVDGRDVNVRSGPSTSTNVLMTVNPGDRLVEVSSKGDWVFIEFPDFEARGWIYGPLLVRPGNAPKATGIVANEIPSPNPVTETQPAPAPALAPERQETPAPTPSPVLAAESPAPLAPEPPAPVAPAPEPFIAASAPENPPAENIETALAQTGEIEQQPQPVVDVVAVPLDQEPAAVKSFRETVSELNDRAVSVAGINLFNDVRSIGGGSVQVLATETWASVPEAGQSSYMNALFDRWQSMANGLGPLSLQIVAPNGQIMMERSGS